MNCRDMVFGEGLGVGEEMLRGWGGGGGEWEDGEEEAGKEEHLLG